MAAEYGDDGLRDEADACESSERRAFLKNTALGLLAATLSGGMLSGCRKLIVEGVGPTPALAASTIESLVRQAVDGVGGMRRYVKPGQIVAIKPNASFAQAPAVGATTHPEVVKAVVKMALEADAKAVHVFDYTLHEQRLCYAKNGIGEAVKDAGGKVLYVNDSGMFREQKIPGGVILKSHKVLKPYLDADVLINVPTAKQHGATGASIGMKNLMGLIYDRGIYHGNNIHECLADLLSAIRPALTIVDATRVLLTNGPAGPGKVKVFNAVLASADPVAADAAAVREFLSAGGIKLGDTAYIGKAMARGLGKSDGKVSIARG